MDAVNISQRLEWMLSIYPRGWYGCCQYIPEVGMDAVNITQDGMDAVNISQRLVWMLSI